MAKYFGKDQRQLQRVEWNRLRQDRNYRVVREYDNGVIYVRLEWRGEIDDIATFRDCWKMFVLHVGNYTDTGDIRPDPVENCRTFAYEADGIAAYEKFLESWTLSHRNADGEFEEEDNNLIPEPPPAPPNPDAPTSDMSAVKGLDLGDSDIGAW